MPEVGLHDVAASVHDVLVVGAGPAGSSCAYWLADAGWDVVILDKKVLPREKTCGDGLTPRAVRQLADLGLEAEVAASAHRFRGLRAVGFGHTLEMRWPTHPTFPSYGYTITRFDLDAKVAARAARAGASVVFGAEADAPLDPVPSGPDRLATLKGVRAHAKDGTAADVRARYVVVADGSNSRLGRSLGAVRRRDWPLGMALRGYWHSPRHDEDLIESHLDVRDRQGDVVPGYGWVFPLGDGRVNLGVGLLSTEQSWRGVNTSRLLDHFVEQVADSWELKAQDCLGSPTGGKLPMGLSVGPRVGENVLVAGDAAGSINPFNGEGIAYGYETGRLAASHVAAALRGDRDDPLAAYERTLEGSYGDYFRIARGFVRLISEPAVMRACVGVGMRSEWLMTQLLSIMANLLRPDDLGAAEVAYRAIHAIASHVPDGVLDRLLQAAAARRPARVPA